VGESLCGNGQVTTISVLLIFNLAMACSRVKLVLLHAYEGQGGCRVVLARPVLRQSSHPKETYMNVRISKALRTSSFLQTFPDRTFCSGNFPPAALRSTSMGAMHPTYIMAFHRWRSAFFAGALRLGLASGRLMNRQLQRAGVLGLHLNRQSTPCNCRLITQH
jgi:hypothetical protein